MSDTYENFILFYGFCLKFVHIKNIYFLVQLNVQLKTTSLCCSHESSLKVKTNLKSHHIYNFCYPYLSFSIAFPFIMGSQWKWDRNGSKEKKRENVCLHSNQLLSAIQFPFFSFLCFVSSFHSAFHTKINIYLCSFRIAVKYCF